MLYAQFNMSQQLDLEIKVIKKFIDKSKQNRFIQFISSLKNRHKFIAELSHFDCLKSNLFVEVNGKEQQMIFAALLKNNISSEICYVISENSQLDCQILNTFYVLKEVIGQGNGTILVFGNADLIFYEGEGPKSRYMSISN